MMFSKSSECNIAMPNEYLCTETCGNQECYGTSPFCATIGQPLVYYCQMPPPKLTQPRGNVRKDNRNCFTKAFRWYTEEHVPHRNESAKKSGDVKGFANWLDSKYEQFLLDQCNSCGYKVKHTSITEAYKFQNEPCETRRKKFRVKRSSLHYILKPKDISRPASETNEMSKAMMMSSEVVLSHYSHSCTSFRVRADPSITVLKRSQEAIPSVNSMKPNNDVTKSLPKIHPEKPKEVVCLCSRIPKRNAYTQSDPSPVKSPSKSVLKAEATSQTVPKSETPSQTAQKATPCSCCPPKYTKISHPTKIEIEFEAKPSLSLELTKCRCSKELIPMADAQCQFQTDVLTCACGSDLSMKQEKSQGMPKKVRLCPCEYDNKDFETCPLKTPLTISNQNQPILCNHCIPCKSTIVTDDGQISNRSNKTTPCPNGLASNSASDHSMKQEKSQSMPKKVRLCPCEYDNKDFKKCPLEPPLTISNQNQPILCNQCIPCKSTVVTDDGQISNRSNKTTPCANGLASNPSNKKTTGCDGILTTNPRTANDGVQTSNQTTIANDGVQTSNHSIRMDKDGTAAAYPLFMKIVFADKLCKF